MSGFYELGQPVLEKEHGWSKPTMTMLTGTSEAHVVHQANVMLSAPQFHVLAISPAIPCTVSKSGDSPHELDPWYTVTVLYQSRH